MIIIYTAHWCWPVTVEW